MLCLAGVPCILDASAHERKAEASIQIQCTLESITSAPKVFKSSGGRSQTITLIQLRMESVLYDMPGPRRKPLQATQAIQ